MFALPSLRGGGSERVVVTLLRHLDRQRFELHLMLLEGAAGIYLRDIPSDVTLHALAVQRIRRAVPKFLRAIWRIQPDVLVSTPGYLNLAFLVLHPLYPRTKMVAREAIGGRMVEDGRYPQLYYRLYPRMVRRADRIVTQSDASAREMSARIRPRPGQLVRLYNPVDTSHIMRQARSISTPLAGPGPHVVAAGRLSYQKGFDLLLDAFAGVVSDGVAATLTILGDGPDRPALEARTRSLGLAHAVQFVGFRENPFPYFAHADVFALSSRFEGLPNVVLEALACGCPVVAFDCPHGAREIVRHNVNGLLVPPEDVAGLRQALVHLLRSPAERARLRAQIAPTLVPFSTAEITRRWEALFDDLTAA